MSHITTRIEKLEQRIGIAPAVKFLWAKSPADADLILERTADSRHRVIVCRWLADGETPSAA